MTMAKGGSRSAGRAKSVDLSSLSGLEIVEHLALGLIPRPPMADLVPFALLTPREGSIEILATPEPRFFNLTRTMHGGWIMTLLDTAMALAAQTTVGPGEICPSHETSAKFLRPVRSESGQLSVTGKVISRGRSVIALEGRVEDREGRLYAHGTSTCMIVRP